MLPESTLETEEETEVAPVEYRRMLNGFLFLFVSAFIAFGVAGSVAKFLTLVFTFVGIFEMVVFPLWMILEINKRKQILGENEKVLIFIFASLYIILSIVVFFANIFLDSLG